MRFYFVVIMVAVCVSNAVNAGENWQKVLNLKGRWLFSIGDNKKWSDPDYTDKDWESIEVPRKWEDEGFYGYNGYAWYRKTFSGIDLKAKNGSYNLFLGYIDDVDEVYLNGHKIGSSGSFPPRYQTAFNAFRNYNLPNEYINFQGKNVIAVRVYDAEIEGGIVSGEIGIYVNEDDKSLTINLRGTWDFTLAEKQYHSDLNYSSREKRTPPENVVWKKLAVPGVWENQGLHNYDGSAWYRKQFFVPKELAGEDLVLLLGKIDDFDQTYLNGKIVGSTNDYDKLRIYYIPADAVHPGALNLLLIYVYDGQGLGGISEGPIGIMKQSEFTRYIRWRK